MPLAVTCVDSRHQANSFHLHPPNRYKKMEEDMQTDIVSSQRQKVLRRIILLGTPLILGVLELGHPLLDRVNPIKMLAPISMWWIVLHLLLIPLFALMGYAIFILIRDINSPSAILCRYATVIYISFAIGYDALVGLTSGVLASNASSLTNAQQSILLEAMHQFYTSPAITVSGYILVVSGILSICAAAWTLYHAGVPLLPVIVLLGTVLTAYSHALPFGPIGSACFFVAALWIELVWRKSPSGEKHGMGNDGATHKDEVLTGNVVSGEQA